MPPSKTILHEAAGLCPQPVGIFGYGVEGKSTCRFLSACGFKSIIIFDAKKPESVPPGVLYGGTGRHSRDFDNINTLFRSAGIRPDCPEIQRFAAKDGVLTSQTELFFDLAPSRQIIGITGTLGKGTCCSLLESMLKADNRPAALGGNIGTAALDLLIPYNPDTIYILELSSFQLSTLKKPPRRAAVLKTTSEHLDWHTNRREYWECKANMVRHMHKKGFLVYCEDEEGSRYISEKAACRKMGYGKNKIINVSESEISSRLPDFPQPIRYSDLKIAGLFNLENIAAAAAIAKDIGVTNESVITTAQNFTGLAHRMEFAGAHKSIHFYNDSYATRPEAAMGAISTFADRPLAVILGGSEKYADFTMLAETIAKSPNIRAIALIGLTAPRLKSALRTQDDSGLPELRICKDLHEAVMYLISKLDKGVVLLSPACASFGLFKNYKHRGEVFRSIVQAIISQSGGMY